MKTCAEVFMVAFFGLIFGTTTSWQVEPRASSRIAADNSAQTRGKRDSTFDSPELEE